MDRTYKKQWMMTEESMKESGDRHLDHPVVLMLKRLHGCVYVFECGMCVNCFILKVCTVCMCGAFYVSGYEQIQ